MKISPDERNRERYCEEKKSEPCGIVIFGASGDLVRRKLIPALFSLSQRDLLAENFFILGCGRSQMNDTTFREKVKPAISEATSGSRSSRNAFINKCYYTAGEYDNAGYYSELSDKITSIMKSGHAVHTIIFYLAVPSELYCSIVENLSDSGLFSETNFKIRIVLEKPFGYDLESAMSLNKGIRRILSEDKIYRIDHYLGKETVQNILMFRFANAIFEPVWNRRYIDTIQITVAETLGVEQRQGYFEKAGLLRDMFQNHMMQMLSLVAMEPPASFDGNRVRDEKVKLLRAVRPFPLKELDKWIVRGQYSAGTMNSKKVCGYCSEKGINPHSHTETFVAAKFMIDNWRWQGVPFYLRSGKRLKRCESKIVIVFKEVPHSMFSTFNSGKLPRNILVFNVQPEEGVSLTIETKSPGNRLCVSMQVMDFHYKEVFGIDPPDAYERLLLDCMLGDQTLFIRQDDMEVAWSLFTPVLNEWRDNKDICPLYPYNPESWGPEESDTLFNSDGHCWYTSTDNDK